MAYERTQKEGLKYLQHILLEAKIPGDTKIAGLFTKIADGESTPLLKEEVTVDQIMHVDLSTDDEDAYLAWIGTEACEIKQNIEKHEYYFIYPDGSGKVKLDVNGLIPLTIDGRRRFSHEIAGYVNFYNHLCGFLVPESIQTGDITNLEELNRLVHKNNNGQWVPVITDLAKFTSDLKQDRIQAIADVEAAIKKNSAYIRDEDGILSKVALAPGNTLYRSEYDADSLKAIIAKEKPLPYGSVAMFFMKLFQSMGIHWFDNLLGKQEAAEALQEAEFNRISEQRNAEANTLSQPAPEVGKTALLAPAWNAFNELENAMLDDAQRGRVSKLLGNAYAYEMLGMVAGVLAQDLNPAMVARFLTGFTSGEKVWNDSEMKKFIDSGIQKFEDAMNAFSGSADSFDALPMQKLLHDAVDRIAEYTVNMVPLDKRAVMLGDLTERIVKYTREIPALTAAFSSSEDLTLATGIMGLGKMVDEGLRAQFNLANGKTDLKDQDRDIGDYLAFKTAEQIMKVDAFLIHTESPYAPASKYDFIRLLGAHGRVPFQRSFEDFCHREFDPLNPKANLEKAKMLAADDFTNGSKAKIVQIVREAAKDFKYVQHTKDQKPGKSAKKANEKEQVAVYRGGEKAPKEAPELKVPQSNILR